MYGPYGKLENMHGITVRLKLHARVSKAKHAWDYSETKT